MNARAGRLPMSPSTPPRQNGSEGSQLQPHPQQENQPSAPPSPPDLASFNGQNVLAMIRRRRAGEQSNSPQARIYKKARMRTRNWSELRQRVQEQPDAPAYPPNDATLEAPIQHFQHINYDVAQNPGSVPDDVLAVTDDAASAPEPTIQQLNPPLPRDHLLLLVPPSPHITNNQRNNE